MIAKIYAEIPANISNPTYNGRKSVDKILTNLSIQPPLSAIFQLYHGELLELAMCIIVALLK
jgi:hypothetical protein